MTLGIVSLDLDLMKLWQAQSDRGVIDKLIDSDVDRLYAHWNIEPDDHGRSKRIQLRFKAKTSQSKGFKTFTLDVEPSYVASPEPQPGINQYPSGYSVRFIPSLPLSTELVKHFSHSDPLSGQLYLLNGAAVEVTASSLTGVVGMKVIPPMHQTIDTVLGYAGVHPKEYKPMGKK